MFLTRPEIKYKESFLKALAEYNKEGRYLEYFADEIEKDFEKFCRRFWEKEKGVNLKEGMVPETTFWLIDGGEFIGRVSIRHELTEKLKREGGHVGYDIRPTRRGLGYGTKILELALEEAKKMGFERVLLTCDATNIASRKIIIKNGGVFDSQVDAGEGKSPKLRFWIILEK